MSLDIVTYSKLMQVAKKIGYVGTKNVDETGLTDEDILYYSKDLDEYIVKELKIKVREWQPNTEYEKDEIVIFDNIIHWVKTDDYKSHQSSIDFDLIDGKIIPLVAESGLANVLGLEYTINQDKTQIELTWGNPSTDSYEGREIFLGINKDITGMTYQECEDLATGVTPLSQQVVSVEKVEKGLGTGLGQEDSFTIDLTERNKYYIKIFVKHATEDGIKTSTGRYITVDNPDVTAPIATNDLSCTVDTGKVTLTWTQPTDDDFLYAKLVRSTTGAPQSPSDGIVLDTISGMGTFVDTNIDKGVQYCYKLFFYDDAGNGFEYGVEGNWSKSNVVTCIDVATYGFNVNTEKRTRDAVGLKQEDFNSRAPWSDITRGVANELGEIVYYLDEDDSELKEDGVTQADLTGGDGNVVVEYPEFFYSYENGEMLIANEEFQGAKRFERTIVGAFEATENVMGELQSVVGERPLTGKSISEYRNMSRGIGEGWYQRDFEFLLVLRMLFAIEYGGLNSQELIGQGVTDMSEQNFTGSTTELGNKSGVSFDYAVSYRGLENPWGNTWEFVEGLYITDEAYFTTVNGYDTFLGEDDIGDYVNTGIVPTTQNGFMSKMEEDLIVASENIGDSISFTGDYQHSHNEGQVNLAVHGGDYRDGDKAGLFRAHMGLKPFGKEEEMDLVEGSVYEKELTESDLEEIKNVVVSQGVVQ